MTSTSVDSASGVVPHEESVAIRLSSANTGEQSSSPSSRSKNSVLNHGRAANSRAQRQSFVETSEVAEYAAPEVTTMIEIRASLKRYSRRHNLAASYYQRRFILFAVASLVATSMAPIVEVLEAQLGSHIVIKLAKALLSAIAIMMVGLQNMMGYQSLSHLHTNAADEFDNLRSDFDYEVWYRCAPLSMDSQKDIKTSRELLENFLKEKGKQSKRFKGKPLHYLFSFVRRIYATMFTVMMQEIMIAGRGCQCAKLLCILDATTRLKRTRGRSA